MGTYRLNEGEFDLPEGWVDQTMNVFPCSTATPSEFSIVITRDFPLSREDLKSYVERQSKQLPNALPGLKMLRKGELTVGGLPALDAEFTWVAKGTKMHQRQVYVMCQGKVLTITATTPDPAYPKHAAHFDRILNSFAFEQ